MHRRQLLVALGLAGLTAGCAGVPTSGPVARVSADPGRINPGVEIAPAPPDRNASPGEVVEGFLHAMASWQPDYGVARTYLTERANETWNPSAGVRIYAEGNPVSSTDTGARLVAPIVGTLDAAGSYHQSTGQLEHDFGLVQVADQWRIDSPPEGLIVSEYLFSSAFTRVVVYHWAPGREWLVPDPRFFPRGAYALEGAVRAVTADPPSWLAPGLDHQLLLVGFASAHIDSTGVVQVRLERLGPDLDDVARRQLVARLVWTLRPFENATGVEVAWTDGIPWQVDTYTRAVPLDAFPAADPQDRQTSRQLFAVVGGRVVRAMEGAGGLESIPAAPGLEGVSFAAVRPDALQVAAVTGDRTALVTAPMSEPGSQPVASAIGLRRPHYARQGELWVSDDRGAISAVLADGTWVTASVTGLGDGRVSVLRLAPDGVRVALVIEQPGGTSSVAVGVVSRIGTQLAIEGVRQLSVSDSIAARAVRDVGWRTADTLMVLTTDGHSSIVMSLAQDGSMIAPVGPSGEDNLVEMAVAPGVVPFVRRANGEVLRYNADFRWSTLPATVSSLFYPG